MHHLQQLRCHRCGAAPAAQQKQLCAASTYLSKRLSTVCCYNSVTKGPLMLGHGYAASILLFLILQAVFNFLLIIGRPCCCCCCCC
jgi:hypothetical protein